MTTSTDFLPARRSPDEGAARPTDPSGRFSCGRRGLSAAPALGARVEFQRSPTHNPEEGTVQCRQIGTGIIEVADRNGHFLRLAAGEYRQIADAPTSHHPAHGRQPSPGAPTPAPGEDQGGAS